MGTENTKVPGDFAVELEMIETEASDKLNQLYESAGFTPVPFGRIRTFGDANDVFIYSPDGWRELHIEMKVEDDEDDKPEGEEGKWDAAKMARMKGFSKKEEGKDLKPDAGGYNVPAGK